MAAPPQAVASTTALPVGVPGTSFTPKFQVRVRYPRRMKVQRVYRMVVELRPEKPGSSSVSAGDSVIARPVIPGAFVQPPEQELGPKASNSRITFSVTPLAQGGLSGARLQIVHQGRVLEEIRTPLRGTGLQGTIVFLILTLLSGGFFLHLLPTEWFDLSSTGPKSMELSLPAIDPAEIPPGKTAPELKTKMRAGPVWQTVVDRVPPYEEHFPEAVMEHLASKTKLAEYLQEEYDALWRDLPQTVSFWFTAGFFILTLLSLIWNRPVLLRSLRKGKPMVLPALPDQGGNPLTFGR